MFTKFFDMSSGGHTKLQIDGKYKKRIYIELPKDEAIAYFVQRFGRDPYNITCYCCGQDYSVSEAESLEEITMYNRQDWRTKEFISVEEYAKRDDVLIIYKEDIDKNT